jgi:hypothetical protein
LEAGTYFARITPWSSAQSNYRFALNVVGSGGGNPTGQFQITLDMSGLTASQQTVFQQAVDRWEQVIVGDLPDAVYQGRIVDDVLIDASAVAIDGVGGILGQAGPDAVRASWLPIHGIMQFDTADMANMEQNGILFGVIMHEIGHVLGVGTVWRNLGLLVGAGTANPIFIGAQATAAYNQIFGTSAQGVPVENSGGPGTRDAHFRESILDSELMTGYAEYGAMPLSRITIGSLADIGYQVNFAAADAYARPTSVLATPGSLTTGTTSLAHLHGVNAVLPASPVGLANGSSATTTVAGYGNASRSHGAIDAAIATARVGVSQASVPHLSAARIAVIESRNANCESDDFDDSPTNVALAAFEAAWNDLAADLLKSTFA